MKRATLVFVVKDGHVLLGMKKSGEIGTGTWNGPGGKIEPGETAIACLLREVEEELDIRLIPDALEEIATILFRNNESDDFYVHVYRTALFEGTPRETLYMLPRAFPIDELPYEHMLPGDSLWIPRVLSGSRFSALVERRSADLSIEFLPFGAILA